MSTLPIPGMDFITLDEATAVIRRAQDRLRQLREQNDLDPGWLSDEITDAEAELRAATDLANAIVARGTSDCIGSA
jgi:hypothetical protein